MDVVRVLGVDDDPNILEVMRLMFLGQEKVELTSFYNPLEALEHLEKEAETEYAVAFVDIKMPGMTGIEFLSHLRNISPRTVRINMSSHADLQLVLEALGSNHIFDFIRKPLSKEDFLTTYSKAVEYYELRVERDMLAEILLEKNALLEQWNQCLDSEVQRKTFELKLRDRLMQHLSGCVHLDDPFSVVHDFANATVPGMEQAIYAFDQQRWKLLAPQNTASFPAFFNSSETGTARYGTASPEELAHLAQCMGIERSLLWAEVLQYRGAVVGCWCLTVKEPKPTVPSQELSNFAPLVALLIYDRLILESLDNPHLPGINSDDLE